MNDLPPFTIAFFRLLIAFIILFPIGYRLAWKHRFTFWKYKCPFLVMTLSGVAFFNTFIYGALQFTSATNVSVLESVIPVITVILSALLLKERLMPIQSAGIILSFIGAIWVVLDGKVLQLTTLDWNIGDGIMLGAVLSWAVYSICVKRYMHLFPQFAALLVMTGISVIVLLPVALIEWSVKGIPSFVFPDHAAGLAYLGIFPSCIALVFYNRAVYLLGPSKASIFLNFIPVFTMIGAYLWLSETITVMQITGSVIVIAGVLLTTQVSRKLDGGNKKEQPKKLSV